MMSCSSQSLSSSISTQKPRRWIPTCSERTNHSDHSQSCKNPIPYTAPSEPRVAALQRNRNRCTLPRVPMRNSASPQICGRSRTYSRKGASGARRSCSIPQWTRRNRPQLSRKCVLRQIRSSLAFYQLPPTNCAANASTSFTGNSHA